MIVFAGTRLIEDLKKLHNIRYIREIGSNLSIVCIGKTVEPDFDVRSSWSLYGYSLIIINELKIYGRGVCELVSACDLR